MTIGRRTFCIRTLAAAAGCLSASAMAAPAKSAGSAALQASGTPFEPWRPGLLDLHHISTGRGNAVLAICPDGTSILVDAGAVVSSPPALSPARPDSTRRPGEWIGRYARHHLRATLPPGDAHPGPQLDYLVVTHFHGDHMGDLTPDSPLAASGSYRLTGVSDVAALLLVRTLIDRGAPDYVYPAPLTGPGPRNYIAFAQHLARSGASLERLRPGSATQIVLRRNPALYPHFAIRNLAANGEIWTGAGQRTRQLFPPLSTLPPQDYPTENACSIALRFDFGPFRYYLPGDLVNDTRFGTAPWQDVETPVAAAAGPVHVAVLNHHGYFDSTSPEFVRNLRARVYIAQTWHASQPALATLDRLYSPLLQPGPRDVLATNLCPAAALACDRYVPRLLSRSGHIVVRVANGGREYSVFVLDDTREEGTATLLLHEKT